ncbi:MAG TPA: hypothetical protein VF519_15905 [Mycobacteriales bacterium]
MLAPTADVVATFAPRPAARAGTRPVPPVPVPPLPRAASDPARLALAALRLYEHLGATALVKEAVRGADLPPAEAHRVAADVAWAEGRYRHARRHYRRALAGDDPATRLRRRERVAATHWVQGRLVLAAALLGRAIRAARRDGVDPAPAADTLLNVVRHLRRSPETRWLPLDRVERRALALLPPAGERRGTHLDVRFATLRADVPGAMSQAERLAAQQRAVESFAQYEALEGVLNFEHGRLRRRIEAGERVDPEEVRRQRRRAEALGRTESAWKTVLLPGTAGVYGTREALRAALRLQVTPWQRLRFLARHWGR